MVWHFTYNVPVFTVHCCENTDDSATTYANLYFHNTDSVFFVYIHLSLIYVEFAALCADCDGLCKLRNSLRFQFYKRIPWIIVIESNALCCRAAFSTVYSNYFEWNVRNHINIARRAGKLIQRLLHCERHLLKSFRTISFETEKFYIFGL